MYKCVIGTTILGIMLLMAVFAGQIAPHDPAAQYLAERLQPPSFVSGRPDHVLGTDAVGRDVLSRLIHGARVSLLVGLAAVLVAGVFGVAFGVLSGFAGGWVDGVLMRVVDIQMSIPFMVLALAVMAILGPSLRNVIIVLAISSWVSYARVARAGVIALKHSDMVEAARALGASSGRVVLRYLLPQLQSSLVVVATLEVGRMILAEASLSYLGMGVPPSVPTWGSIAADGRDYITTAWWIATLPGFAILMTVLGINFVGDWLRDRLDPTLRV